MQRALLSPLLLLLFAAPYAAALPGQGDDAGKTVMYRDTWGVPHIYAPTESAGMYAMGWAQAEDRPEELLKNFATGIGESARFAGEDGIQSDVFAQTFDHYGVSQRNLDKLRPDVRANIEAFVRGINDFYAAHPADRPAWWGDRPVDVAMVIAFGRLFLYNWSIDDGVADLQRIGVNPGIDRDLRGSNQWAISPARSAEGAAMLYIDPHLSWWGPSRFWEVRIHAGKLQGSGFTLAGTPFIGLGHNDKVAWAMTTGGPDTADIYQLTLNPEKRTQYQYEGAWVDMGVREAVIPAGEGDPLRMPIYDTRFGPVIASKDNVAYALKTAYAECVQLNEAWYMLNTARNIADVQAALATQMFFPQNIMAADAAGDIYYQRTGRVPNRPEGFDFSRPVDGSTKATEWLGIHDTKDLVQLINPPQGYMQNCNIPPDAMIVNSPLQPAKYRDYIFSDLGYGERGGWSNERGARALELLHHDDSVTIAEMTAYALDASPYPAPRWIALLKAADAAKGAAYKDDAAYQAALADLLAWDGHLRHDSTGGLKYFYWRNALRETLGAGMEPLREKVDQYYRNAQGLEPLPVEASDAELQAAVDSLAKGMQQQQAEFSLDAKYGDKFRVGRDDQSWPVGGGGDKGLGMRTLRSVGFEDERDDHTAWGRNGQTSTQVVVLSQPVKSWTAPPIGQSDRPDSPHYRDQAEKVFSPQTMKSTWWMPEELNDHIESRTELPDAVR
jgi:acyl-homoserine lactone acylase PvdQ